MKAYCIFIMFFFLIACSHINRNDRETPQQSVERQLQELTQRITEAESNDDLPAFLKYYHSQAIIMPEYQLTLDGHEEMEVFYAEIFKRQNVKLFQRQSNEFIRLGKIIVEIGTFHKKYTQSGVDSVITLTGKYWNVWAQEANGDFKIHGEAFGYFRPVDNPENLVIAGSEKQQNESDVIKETQAPFELMAYNALMEKGVRKRDAILRSGFFTEDARLFPFADTIVTGIKEIKPYLIDYSSRGTVTIDSIQCYTYAFENAGEYVLEYDMFKVKWSRPDHSGRTEGKGIRIWKRQEDHSLRLYREIGTHNHLN